MKKILIMFALSLVCGSLFSQTFRVRVFYGSCDPEAYERMLAARGEELFKLVKDSSDGESSLSLTWGETASAAKTNAMPYLNSPAEAPNEWQVKFRDIGTKLQVALPGRFQGKGPSKGSSSWFSSEDSSDGKDVSPEDRRIALQVSFSISEFEGFMEYGQKDSAIKCPTFIEDYFNGLIVLRPGEPALLKSGVRVEAVQTVGERKSEKRAYYYAIIIDEILPPPAPAKK